MTPSAFWAAARAKGPWRVTSMGSVRNAAWQCPLGAVMQHREIIAPFALDAARALAIPLRVAAAIAGAADYSTDPRRALLLRELGIEEGR